MEESISTSASTIRSLHSYFPEHMRREHSQNSGGGVSTPSSPRSSALPSPPDSPSSESVSSLPSVSSSFFFSSAAASPGPSQPQSDHGRDHTTGLIIPSLTLPPALRRPTPYGKTLGEVRLLVLGGKGTGKTFLSGMLLEDNEDIVDVGSWEDTEYGQVLHASTDWIEHRDEHGYEKFEPTRNVEIVELPGYDHTTDMTSLMRDIKSLIHEPFHSVSEALHPTQRLSPVVANLVSAPTVPFYTALIFLLPSAPTSLDISLIDVLSPEIPIIVLPRLSSHSRSISLSKLSSYQPSSTLSLRAGLFQSPETLSLLRSEAGDRFLRWREVEHAVEDIHKSRRRRAGGEKSKSRGETWDKAKWEAEWTASLSQDVATRLREGTITERPQSVSRQGSIQPPRTNRDQARGRSSPTSDLSASQFDPLHFPSLVRFSLSLLGPLRARVARSFSPITDAIREYNVHLAVLSGFCLGVGVGLVIQSQSFR